MKKILKKRLITSILAICMVAVCLPPGSFAAGEIYVNDGSGVLGTGLGEAYAVGGDGTVASISGNTAYAMTGSGLQEITGGGNHSAPGDVTAAPVSGTVQIKSATLKVGLYYYYSGSRDSSLPSATLALQNGTGFTFGYYDSSRHFHEVGSTSETTVTVVKDTNVTTAGGTIGCYHIKLSGSYGSFSAATTAASAYTDGFPAYYNGTYYVLVGQYQTQSAAESALSSRGLNGEAYSASNRCVVVTKTNSTKILFEYDCGTSTSVALKPVSSGKSLTRIGSYTYYGDFEFNRTQGGNMTVINYVNIEDYVKGVIPYEMSSSWPIEALKAQACCARTYAAANYNSYGNYGFDLTNDTYCQVYHGTGSANSTTNSAVDQTAGLYVTYNGKLCSTLYFSSDGGATEDSENIFTSAYPYLRGKTDPFEASIPSFSYKSWSYEFTAAEIRTKLINKGYGIGDIVSITPEYTRNGNMYSLTFRDNTGYEVYIIKTSCYSVLGLPSIHFTITKSSAGTYVIKGGGWGHNVGMSQWGAYSMAYYHGYSYAHILGFYYTGVSLSTGV